MVDVVWLCIICMYNDVGAIVGRTGADLSTPYLTIIILHANYSAKPRNYYTENIICINYLYIILMMQKRIGFSVIFISILET